MGKGLIATVALIALCSSLALAADKRVIRPKGAEANAGWSHGILIDGTLYVAPKPTDDGRRGQARRSRARGNHGHCEKVDCIAGLHVA